MWKNGGGESVTIAEERLSGAAEQDWSAIIWQLGFTTIATPGPFSDLSGYQRLQTVVRGRGLVLVLDQGGIRREIDLTEPLTIARYDGAPSISSRLAAGPVEVINLIGRADRVALDMRILAPGEGAALAPATHVLFAFGTAATLSLEGSAATIPAGHAARLDEGVALRVEGGPVLLASVVPRGA
jgi:environmental stress-induced protein Ves